MSEAGIHKPHKCVSDGILEVTFDQPEESNLNRRQQLIVCDIWLIKK